MTLKTHAQVEEQARNRKVVVACDFGTTNSGLAWAQNFRPEVMEAIVQWLDQNGTLQGKTQAKVPTELLYTSEGLKWGFQIAEHEQRHLWFKLGLDPNQPDQVSHLSVEYPDPKALPPSYNHDPVKLATDYLTCLRTHTYEILKLKLGQGVVESTPIQFIVTVPAIWDDAAKDRTTACAVAAGMGENVRIITEPEAAVVYTLDNMDPHNLKCEDTFVLVDAGGGTVDLISYKIVELSQGRVKVREVVAGDGDLCGTTFLNRIFGRYLDEQFGDNYFWDEDIKEDAMRSFEAAKREFTGDDKMSVLVNGLPDDTSKGVKRGRLYISAEKVKSLFEPVMASITTLVVRQIKHTKNAKAVLLVGGFGQSIYLRKCIERVVGPGIEVLQPADAWTAIVKGALIWALNDDAPDMSRIEIVSRVARKHYGIRAATLFDPAVHEAGRKSFDNFDGRYKVEVMSWFINKGDEIDQNSPLVTRWLSRSPVSYGPIVSKNVRLYSFSSKGDNPAPLYPSSDSKHLVSLEADLSSIPSHLIPTQVGKHGQEYYVLHFEIRVAFFSAHTEYSLWYLGQEYGKVQAEYA